MASRCGLRPRSLNPSLSRRLSRRPNRSRLLSPPWSSRRARARQHHRSTPRPSLRRRASVPAICPSRSRCRPSQLAASRSRLRSPPRPRSPRAQRLLQSRCRSRTRSKRRSGPSRSTRTSIKALLPREMRHLPTSTSPPSAKPTRTARNCGSSWLRRQQRLLLLLRRKRPRRLRQR